MTALVNQTSRESQRTSNPAHTLSQTISSFEIHGQGLQIRVTVRIPKWTP